MVCLKGSVFNRCQDVLSLQVGIVPEDLLERSPRPEEFQDVGYTNPHPANAGAPPALAFLNGDSLEPFWGHIAASVRNHSRAFRFQHTSFAGECHWFVTKAHPRPVKWQEIRETLHYAAEAVCDWELPVAGGS